MLAQAKWIQSLTKLGQLVVRKERQGQNSMETQESFT